MTHRRARPPEARDHPALVEFLRGYLHQDFEEEYGSPGAAFDAFARDASPAELSTFRAEAGRFWEAARALSPSALEALLRDRFGCSWAPRDHAEAERFFLRAAGEDGGQVSNL